MLSSGTANETAPEIIEGDGAFGTTICFVPPRVLVLPGPLSPILLEHDDNLQLAGQLHVRTPGCQAREDSTEQILWNSQSPASAEPPLQGPSLHVHLVARACCADLCCDLAADMSPPPSQTPRL